MRDPYLLSIHAGKAAPLGPDGIPSAFIKRKLDAPTTVTCLGLVDDEQADHSVHGGPEKAVYGYAHAHYKRWQDEYPKHAASLTPGAFGENLCIAGLEEIDLCVGDVHRIGSTRLQVCQPRQPCFKLALRFQDKMMPKAMIKTGRAGWYYRVIEEGRLAAGDPVRLDDRPNPQFSFARLVELISHGKITPAELQMMAHMPGLASDWQARAQERLSRPG